MAVSSLLKTSFHNSVAESIYNEIATRQSRYYYFLGKTISWGDEFIPETPDNSIVYEANTRNEIITAKEIRPTDVSFVINRINWESGIVYDQYDDTYGDGLIGINLINGGSGYINAPIVYIGSSGSVSWTPNTDFTLGQMVSSGNNYYIITASGITGTIAPSHTTGTLSNGTAQLMSVSIDNGNGTGATATANVLSGAIIDISIDSYGSGYTSTPSITLFGGGGTGAEAECVVSFHALNGSSSLENSNFYVVTDTYNVYKCLNNNNSSESTVIPYGNLVEPVKTSDGYVWKFMYNIPVALRNKFLTNTYMPVTNALHDQYYSGGTLSKINIDTLGSGYTSASISVSGDGFLESDPIYITDIAINDAGTGYSLSPILQVSPPFVGSFPWSSSGNVVTGQYISNDNNIYKVEVSGQLGTSAPTHRFGSVINGDTVLKYVGTTITGTISVISGEIVDVQLNGGLKTIELTDGGFGYNSAPTVHFSGGSGDGASASAVIQGTTVIFVDVVDSGQDYTTAPSIVIGEIWTQNTSLALNSQVFYSNRLYTVTTPGITGTVAPTHASGSATNGTATLQYVGRPATANTSLKYGAGYSEIPTVTISDVGTDANLTLTGVKSEAMLTPNIEGGQITSVNIIDGGTGYTYATFEISGDGDGAAVSADLTVGNLDTIQANNELLVVDGTINNIQIISSGYGYSTATVVIDGDGQDAAAEAILHGGQLIGINITNPGSGYRKATISVVGDGYGAKARAIISPYGGHGKNAINELFARTLMFYTNVSLDKNQGFDVNNDYRQVGILKMPRNYSNTGYLTNNVASGCWAITGNIDTNIFSPDTLIYDTSGHKYRIVTNTGSAVLLQALDNSVPIPGQALSNSENDYFIISQVTPPTIDKYSGSMMFIDNKQAFTPTSEQTVTLRTVIRF